MISFKSYTALIWEQKKPNSILKDLAQCYSNYILFPLTAVASMSKWSFHYSGCLLNFSPESFCWFLHLSHSFVWPSIRKHWIMKFFPLSGPHFFLADFHLFPHQNLVLLEYPLSIRSHCVLIGWITSISLRRSHRFLFLRIWKSKSTGQMMQLWVFLLNTTKAAAIDLNNVPHTPCVFTRRWGSTCTALISSYNISVLPLFTARPISAD